jgi:hypothetical protein
VCVCEREREREWRPEAGGHAPGAGRKGQKRNIYYRLVNKEKNGGVARDREGVTWEGGGIRVVFRSIFSCLRVSAEH